MTPDPTTTDPTTTDSRPMPPLDADEAGTLAAWLDYYRTTLLDRCADLTAEQLRTAAAPPSELTLQGLVQHMAEVERNWFTRVLTGSDAPAIFDPEADVTGPDGGFELSEQVTFADAERIWRREVETARRHCAGRAPDSTSPFLGAAVTLRWIHSHMIAEYARHCGHADLLRERIDGRTGF